MGEERLRSDLCLEHLSVQVRGDPRDRDTDLAGVVPLRVGVLRVPRCVPTSPVLRPRRRPDRPPLLPPPLPPPTPRPDPGGSLLQGTTGGGVLFVGEKEVHVLPTLKRGEGGVVAPIPRSVPSPSDPTPPSPGRNLSRVVSNSSHGR